MAILNEWIYTSPLGEVLLIADDEGLEGIWFLGQKFEAAGISLSRKKQRNRIIDCTINWLDTYFAGQESDPTALPIKDKGTMFQRRVWKEIARIPYGQTTSYKEIAERLAIRSAQAVGGAVGRNPYSILIPCHRVLDSKGNLCGYAGGLEKKKALLDLEGANYRGEKDD